MSYKDKEKQRAAFRKWRASHPEEHRRRCKEWREANREHVAEYMRQYFLDHHEDEHFRELHNAHNRAWRARKKESA